VEEEDLVLLLLDFDDFSLGDVVGVVVELEVFLSVLLLEEEEDFLSVFDDDDFEDPLLVLEEGFEDFVDGVELFVVVEVPLGEDVDGFD
jgi:hypothetical protein